MALFQASILHSSPGTSHSSVLSTYSKNLFQDILRLNYCSVRNFTSDAWPAQFTCFPLGIDVPDFCSMGFEPILLWHPPGIRISVRIGIRLGRDHWKIIWMVGWALCPLLIHGWYWAFCVPVFLSGLVPLCSWIHSILFCKQGFAIPTSYIFVLRDIDQTIHLHEYAAHYCQPLLFCSMSGTIFLPRSTVSLLLSFTLNQVSATTSHSIMPSRGNGKFTCLGFVRDFLIGLALLIRFLVLWFVEWIIIKLSTEVLRSLSSILWQAPSLVPTYHSHSWDLPSLKQSK